MATYGVIIGYVTVRVSRVTLTEKQIWFVLLAFVGVIFKSLKNIRRYVTLVSIAMSSANSRWNRTKFNIIAAKAQKETTRKHYKLTSPCVSTRNRRGGRSPNNFSFFHSLRSATLSCCQSLVVYGGYNHKIVDFFLHMGRLTASETNCSHPWCCLEGIEAGEAGLSARTDTDSPSS